MIYLTLKSTTEQAFQRKKCAVDLLHFIRYFTFVCEPREMGDERDKPFIPYGFQEAEFIFLQKTLSSCASAHGPKANILYEKSRDMGISWVVLYTFLWFFLFHSNSFLIGSRKEEEVDKTGDMDTPFAKLKYALLKIEDTFPWLLPMGWDRKKDTGHMIIRSPLGGQIVGESANAEFGRGGRNLATMFDEFPKWPYAAESWRASSGSTKVRIAIGTPGTDSDKFARLRFQEDGEVIVRTVHWTQHPEKAKDLQWLNGKPTSSWYREELRTNNPEDVAKEIDISYANSIKGRIFDKYGFGHQKRGLCKEAVEGREIIVSWDPGLHFHVLFAQVDAYERMLFLKELYMEGAHLDHVAEAVLDICARYFPDHEFVHCGDPYGSYRQVSAQQDSEFAELQKNYSITVNTAFLSKMPAKERVKARIRLLRRKMEDYVGVTSGPGLLVDPDECPILDRAFGGEYMYKTDINGTVIEQVDEKHPIEDAVDNAGMIALYKLPWGSISRGGDRLRVREVKTKWGRPSNNTISFGRRSA